MSRVDLIPTQLLKRKAVVYVRQSTQSRVMINLESQRRQYDLVDIARQHGFADIAVIDDDLGRSASGTVARPGFERQLAWLCAGKVGAVLCQDASRLARNGRDWHHLLELCGLVEAGVIDHDGIYNPCHPNDRLLLGMKGSISEFELGVLRTRMLDAAKAKARRGELCACQSPWLHLAPGFWAGARSRSAFTGGHPAHLRPLRGVGQRATGPVVDVCRPDPFPSAFGRGADDQLQMDANPLSQRDLRAQEPFLRRCLRLRKKREADLHHRWARSEKLWPQ